MKIQDNFLDKHKFEEIQTFIMSDNFSWYYIDNIDYQKIDSNGKSYYPPSDRCMFTHVFYFGEAPRSQHSNIVEPILNIINPISLWRIKANHLMKTPHIVEDEYHIDMDFVMTKEKLKQWTTSIFYINSNDGYTEFKDGTKVESVANRLITFSSDLQHRGTSCTDSKRRILINFNYFK